VINEDPGAWNAFHPDCGVVKLDTRIVRLSLLRTVSGSRRPYAAKIRSDMVFSGNGWMRYLDRYPAH